jgi:hypothetical protein
VPYTFFQCFGSGPKHTFKRIKNVLDFFKRKKAICLVVQYIKSKKFYKVYVFSLLFLPLDPDPLTDWIRIWIRSTAFIHPFISLDSPVKNACYWALMGCQREVKNNIKLKVQAFPYVKLLVAICNHEMEWNNVKYAAIFVISSWFTRI